MSQNIETVLEILRNEVEGNTNSALEKMTRDYSMTWMYKGNQGIFPKSKLNVKEKLKEVYSIQNRKYEIMNITESDNVVMVELIESYPDPNKSKTHRTPLVLVLEMEKGKIKTGRHYCDPNISYETLSEEILKNAYRDSSPKLVIE